MAKVEVEYTAPVYVLTMSEEERDELVEFLRNHSDHFFDYTHVDNIYQQLVWKDA